MCAKEYLSQARFLDVRINAKIQQIDALRDLATKCTYTFSDMPKNPSREISPTADAVCKIVDLQQEINSDIDKLVDLKREIMVCINDVSNPEYRTVLEKRYLCFNSWEQIAVDMDYSMQYTFRIHKKALKEIETLL